MISARIAALAVVLACAAAAATAAPAGAGPLRTAVTDPWTLTGQTYDLGLRRVRRTGATIVRTTIPWASIAPRAPAPGSNARDPANPAYDWEAFDAKLRALDAAGLEAIVALAASPRWARQQRADRDGLPSPQRLAAFAEAAARRYAAGTDLPAVRYWQLWTEPNVSLYFQPQLDDGRLLSPLLYRQLLQAFTPAIRRGNPAARVVAGGLSPFGRRVESLVAIAPMRFLRHLLCVTPGPTPRRTCRTRVPFDIWAHHPYTRGGPTRRAIRANDVSLGDLPEMRRVLRSAERLGQLNARGPVDFWVTEFSWDSNPSDPKGVPAGLHARWTAEALYRMWTSGVSLVTWFMLRDEPFPRSPFQSGLWYRGETIAQDRPKPALQSFRFPVVAFPQRGRVFVWGRTPTGAPGTVVVERSFGGGWARLGVLGTDRNGIFTTRFRSSARTGFVRARLLAGGELSRPFGLRDPGGRHYNPFGS